MLIPLEKATNCRDLGGIKGALGQVRYGKLLRSGQLNLITAADAQTLRKHGLERIVDLRTAAEIENNPDVAIEGVRAVNVPIIRATTFGISYEKSDGAEIAQKLQAGIERMRQRNETPIEHMRILYRRFVDDDYCRSGFGNFLRLLASEPINGATLWHCSQGKDRVGSCTALLLHCLGVGFDEIMQDYLLTNSQTYANSQSILNKVRPYVSDGMMELVQSMLTVDYSYLDNFFVQAKEQFGSMDGFVAACGVDSDCIDKLRANYLA